MIVIQRTNLTKIVLFLILTLLILSFYAIHLMNQSGNATLMDDIERKKSHNDYFNKSQRHYKVSSGLHFPTKLQYRKTKGVAEMAIQLQREEAENSEIASWLDTTRNDSMFIAKTCSPIVRTTYLKEMCKNIQGHVKKNHAPYLVVEDGRPESKTAGCIAWKAGTNSWRTYLEQGLYRKERKIPDHFCPRTLDRCGPSYSPLRRVLMLDIQELMATSYIRYVIVRHPLQRLVSAYFEEHAQKKITKVDGSKLSFSEYAEAITSNIVDGDPHWARYTTFCALCDMGYEFVVRTETEASDVASFNIKIGVLENITVKHLHYGNAENLQKEHQSNYKYDAMLYSLQKEYPALMRRLLDTYRDDMSVLGYHWDWENGKSSCWIKYNGDICC